MPERADALFEYIERHTSWPADIYLVDNASDVSPPAIHTNLTLQYNIQTTGGWLAGLKAAKQKQKYFAYIFAITSADFPAESGDPITPLAELLIQDDNAVGVHPALTEDSTTSWSHMIARGGDVPRRTWMMDNIFSCYRADWFDSIGQFDPDMRFAWGIDLETCWLARHYGRGLYIHEGTRVRKVTDIGYTMSRMNMSAEERRRQAGENMAYFLSKKYGDNWWWRMTNEYVKDVWR